MNRENLKKHWDIIREYRNGKDIEVKSMITGVWCSIAEPNFDSNREYRVKQYRPNNGDRVLALIDEIWRERIYIKTVCDEYLLVCGSGNNVVDVNSDISTHIVAEIKPLNK